MLLGATVLAMRQAGYSSSRAARLLGALGLEVETFLKTKKLLEALDQLERYE
jgi:hypothetical protein